MPPCSCKGAMMPKTIGLESDTKGTAGSVIEVPSTILVRPTRTLPSGYIHLGVAREIVPTLRDFGIDPDPVIREAGLDPSLFEDGANMIPFAALGRLLTLS